VREAINVGLTKLGFKEIRENQRKVVEAYVGGRDALMVAPTGSGKSLTFHIAPFVLDFYKHGERDLVDTVCLVIFPFGGQSRCLGPRNFRDRKQRSFRGKIQPRVHESRSAIWQSSFQYIGTEEQNSGCIHR